MSRTSRAPFLATKKQDDHRRRASVLDARNRGTRSVPQAVRAKRVRPLHFIHIRVCGYVHNHSRGRSGLTHTFIEPEIQTRAHETRMRTYAKPVTFFGIQTRAHGKRMRTYGRPAALPS